MDSYIIIKDDNYYVQTKDKLLSLFAPDWAIEHFATMTNVANRPYPVWVENVTEDGWYFDGKWITEWLKLDLSHIDFDLPISRSLPESSNYPDNILNIVQDEVKPEFLEYVQRIIDAKKNCKF